MLDGWQACDLSHEVASSQPEPYRSRSSLLHQMGVDRGANSVLWGPRRTDDEACVVRPKHRGVPGIRAVAIACDIDLAIVVANVLRRVIHRVERISVPAFSRLRAEGCVRPIESGAVERLHMKGRVLMPQEVARIVSRLKGDARVVAKAAADDPGCVAFLLRSAAGCDRRDHSGAALVTDIVSGATCRSRLQRDFRSRRQRSR